eukprot:TRINITY_DN1242_c0_g1_i7.p1 TRINITY_DN1242_c0_g1~~TRINITY_DN1242_c0_g1_i7.p1  ORF type:complete len:239 (-),score=67.34 TRINITY_DN1242_c0_g1_i7:115-831(-)
MSREKELKLYSIHQGTVSKITEFGAFVKIEGYKSQGLVHISQISNYRVSSKDIKEMLAINQSVWVKVINKDIDESSGREKISLSIKMVKQSDGQDLDPNNVNLMLEEKKSKPKPQPYKPSIIELEAVLPTTCTRCGGNGHFATDCFSTGGEQFEQLLPLESKNDSNNKTKKDHDKNKLKEKSKSKKDHHSDRDKKESKSKKSNKEKIKSSSSSSSSNSSNNNKVPYFSLYFNNIKFTV